MRALTISGIAALSLFASTAAFAQATGAASSDAGGSVNAPPSMVWVFGQNGWEQRKVGDPMKQRMRGERVARPAIYWRQGNSWFSMPDAATANGRFMSDDFERGESSAK